VLLSGSIIFVLAVLTVLVLIHELGHFFAARWAKVVVEEFGIGIPPRALKLFTWKQTLFTLNWLPVGGFVRMEGEDTIDAEDSPKTDSKKWGPFYSKGVLPRLIIILAGPVINLIFALIIFAGLYSVLGIPTQLATIRVGYVQPGSPAAAAGVPANVELIKLQFADQELVNPNRTEATTALFAHLGQKVTLTTSGPCQESACAESAQTFVAELRADEATAAQQGALGVGFVDQIPVFYPWYEMPFRGMWQGIQESYVMTKQILGFLGMMFFKLIFQGQLLPELVGPVGMVHQTYQFKVVQAGWLPMVLLMGQLSLNLGIFNLLPIPALDGGRAVFLILEKILGKKRTAKFEYYSNQVGIVLLILLFVAISIRDVSRWING
jgi:regulator of sigma E protease